MAITVYAAPKELQAPEWLKGSTFQEHNKKEEEYEKKLIEWVKENSDHKYAGEIVGYPVADGQARYVVFTPSELIHIAIGDAWNYEHIERLLAKDIVQKVKQERNLAKLFNRNL